MGFNFPQALRSVLDGAHMARKAWEIPGLRECKYIFLVPNDGWATDTVEADGLTKLYPGAFVCVRMTHDWMLPWVPSQEDMLAEDWIQL
jgi:hypothetical protein